MITYDGMELSAGAKVLDVRRPLLPPQQVSMLSMELKNGSFFYSKTSGNLSIEIDIMILGADRSEVRENIRSFAGFINASEPKVLIIQDEPDKYIKAILEGNSDLENFYRLGKGTITMIAPDPFYYAIEDDTFTFTDSVVHNFSRKGNTDSYPTIEINGVSSGGSFKVIANDYAMTFTGNLASGESLLLNSELLTASIVDADGLVTSAIPYLDNLDFSVFNSGVNSIKIEANEGAVLGNYFIRCNSRWN